MDDEVRIAKPRLVVECSSKGKPGSSISFSRSLLRLENKMIRIAALRVIGVCPVEIESAAYQTSNSTTSFSIFGSSTPNSEGEPSVLSHIVTYYGVGKDDIFCITISCLATLSSIDGNSSIARGNSKIKGADSEGEQQNKSRPFLSTTPQNQVRDAASTELIVAFHAPSEGDILSRCRIANEKLAAIRLIVECSTKCTEKKSAPRFSHGAPILKIPTSSEGDLGNFLRQDPVNRSDAHVQVLNHQHRLIVVCLAKTDPVARATQKSVISSSLDVKRTFMCISFTIASNTQASSVNSNKISIENEGESREKPFLSLFLEFQFRNEANRANPTSTGPCLPQSSAPVSRIGRKAAPFEVLDRLTRNGRRTTLQRIEVDRSLIDYIFR